MAAELPKEEELLQKLLRIDNDKAFDQVCLEVFRFQYSHNLLYKSFCDLQKTSPAKVKSIIEIPFLPISFFKTHEVVTTTFEKNFFFESSGTTGSINSRHYIKDLKLYEQSFINGFKNFYGHPNDYVILALLPSYLERSNSSLVYMVQKLMEMSEREENGFYLHDVETLYNTIETLEAKMQKTVLIGVTYALLDFAEKKPLALEQTTIIETGGMKGRREEITRKEVHQLLKKAFNISSVHSEYGMTELLSQAYSQKDGIFKTPPWMKVLIREEDDPKSLITQPCKTFSGAINIIDLANLYSCSFIATDDLGKLYNDGSFEVLGRLDNCDIRGCSLLSL